MAYPEVNQYAQMLSGRFFLQLKSGGPMLPVGDWEESKLNLETEQFSIQNNVTAGGGESESLERLKKASVTFSMYNFSAGNVARMLYGDAEAVAEKTYSAQPYTAYKNSLIPLPGILDTADESLAVTNAAGDTPYAKNTDYYAEAGGIVIPGTGAIAGDDSGNGTPVKITFKTAAADVIQALTNSGGEYYARFVSENAARANKKEIADFFRVKFQIIKEMTLTDSGGHKKAAVTLTILADDSRDFNGGLSQHMTIYRGP